MRRPNRQLLKAPATLVVCLIAGCLSPSQTASETQPSVSPEKPGPFQFQRFELSIKPSRHKTIFSGLFSRAEMADLLIAQQSDNGERRLQFYSLAENTWQAWATSSLRKEVLFADVLRVDRHDRLILYDRRGLTWFDPASKTERPLLSVQTHYTAKTEDGIPQIEISRDLNGDQLEDIVVPDIDGFWISLQTANGSFSNPIKIGPPEPFRDEPGLDGSGVSRHQTYGDQGLTPFTAPFYLGRVHQLDYNQDGRTDLVFWNQDHFDVYFQSDQGHFAPSPKSFTTDIAFQADGIYSHSFEFKDVGVGSLLLGLGARIERTMLHSFRDMNGDAIPDIVTVTLSGRSPIKQRSVYNVHFGKASANKLHFSKEPDTSLRPRSKSGGGQAWGYADRRFDDLDGDGQIDFVLKDISIGLGGMVRALAGNSIGIDLEFFRMTGSTFPKKPNHTQKIRTKLSPFGKRDPYLPAVLLGDLNSDGYADLLTGHAKGFDIYQGVPGSKLFTQKPIKLLINMPNNGENVSLVNLNNDGKPDILLHHRSRKEPERLTILITQ